MAASFHWACGSSPCNPQPTSEPKRAPTSFRGSREAARRRTGRRGLKIILPDPCAKDEMKDNQPWQFPSKKHYTPIMRKNTVQYCIRISHAMIEARSIADSRICRPSIQPYFSEPQSLFVILKSSCGSGGTDQAPDKSLGVETYRREWVIPTRTDDHPLAQSRRPIAILSQCWS